MATKTRRITLAERKAQVQTDFTHTSAWDYSTPAGKRKGELEDQARKFAMAIVVLLAEAAATADVSERAVLATVAARKLATAKAAMAPFTGLELPEILRG